jgi:hypothetical protein
MWYSELSANRQSKTCTFRNEVDFRMSDSDYQKLTGQLLQWLGSTSPVCSVPKIIVGLALVGVVCDLIALAGEAYFVGRSGIFEVATIEGDQPVQTLRSNLLEERYDDADGEDSLLTCEDNI